MNRAVHVILLNILAFHNRTARPKSKHARRNVNYRIENMMIIMFHAESKVARPNRSIFHTLYSLRLGIPHWRASDISRNFALWSLVPIKLRDWAKLEYLVEFASISLSHFPSRQLSTRNLLTVLTLCFVVKSSPNSYDTKRNYCQSVSIRLSFLSHFFCSFIAESERSSYPTLFTNVFFLVLREWSPYFTFRRCVFPLLPRLSSFSR